jgi:hypothetical protein
MATYPPPTETLPEFDPGVFSTNDTGLTIAEGKKYFLTFPTAQGTENLINVNVAGDLITTKNAHNLGFGFQSLQLSTGTDNTAFGYQALKSSTIGNSNSAFGDLALPNLTGGAGLRNTGVGHQSGLNLQTGLDNTFVGYNAGKGTGGLRTGSSSNVGVGSDALRDITTGQLNVAVGASAGFAITTGGSNTAVGHQSGGSLIGGSRNTFAGWGSGLGINSGTDNVVVGYQVSSSLSTGSNNVLIGSGVDATSSAISNSVALGFNAKVGASNSVAIGTGVTASTANQIVLGTTAETVLLNSITPLYTTVPTYTSANIGFIQTATITYPGTTANTIASYTAPAGTWIVNVSLNFTSTTNLNVINVLNAGTTVGYILRNAFGSDWYSGSIVTKIATGTAVLSIVPSGAPASGGLDAGAVGQFVRFIRIA